MDDSAVDGKRDFFAVYDNFVIGPAPYYKMLSIGNYHGDAGG